MTDNMQLAINKKLDEAVESVLWDMINRGWDRETAINDYLKSSVFGPALVEKLREQVNTELHSLKLEITNG